MMMQTQLKCGCGGEIAIDHANNLAKSMQRAFPLVSDPFARLGESLGLSEEQVLDQVRRWSEQGLLREISAILEGSALGHESALVAGVVPESALDRVAEIVNQHPTVTHNYEREHRYNLWFTIAAPLEVGLDQMLRALERATGIEQFFPLRRTHTFKIGVNFDLKTRQSCTSAVELVTPPSVRLTPRDRQLYRLLQKPLPLLSRPFEALAQSAGFEEVELLEFAKKHLGASIRRYVATFHHRRLGVRGNGMVVWNVPTERLAEVGPHLAQATPVSHCYARNAIAGFPYTLYSMIHGPDTDSCRATAAELSQQIGISDYLILFSTREFKKCRLRYFLPELDSWCRDHGVADIDVAASVI